MNNPFDYTPDRECLDAFRKLTETIDSLRLSRNPIHLNLCSELDSGKMLGVLIAADKSGIRHTLYAFSGQLNNSGFNFPGFVGPIFDYLEPDGYFKTKEIEIANLSTYITRYENGPLAKAISDYESLKSELDAEIIEFKEKCSISKAKRKSIRESHNPDQTILESLIRQSQFEKAELHRLKKRSEAILQPFYDTMESARNLLDSLKSKRKAKSESLQQWLFANFQIPNATGSKKSLTGIFADTPFKTPPSGAGECCAPKLLYAAYTRNLTPISMAEFWYGRPKDGEVRMHGRHYPACHGKCMPILNWMLRGLDVDPPLSSESQHQYSCEPKILFENQWFCIIDKPSGMLSVPGKSKALSVQHWLESKYGADKDVKLVHRLDQDTSGLMVASFGHLAYKTIQTLFATRKVKKTYIAELDGIYTERGLPKSGRIDLPLAPDWMDRPRQKIDYLNGKPALTDYEFINLSQHHSRVIFHPLTGRTHQLRVHAASQSGLAMPIAGDRLYGNTAASPSTNGYQAGNNSQPLPIARLLLHAHKLEFIFPIDNNRYSFASPIPF